MTTKEAIKILNQLWGIETLSQDKRDAFELAIRALRSYRNCKKCIHNVLTPSGKMHICELGDCDFEELDTYDE